MTSALYDFVMSGLRRTKGNWPTVARDSGVSIRTLEKVARQERRNPRIQTVEALAAYFRKHQK